MPVKVEPEQDLLGLSEGDLYQQLVDISGESEEVVAGSAATPGMPVGIYGEEEPPETKPAV